MISKKLACVLLLTCSMANAADKPKVTIEQMKLAASVAASCSGFYDGVYALMQNLASRNQLEGNALFKIWPRVNKRFVFRQSTASMLMTDIFIGQINQGFNPNPALSLQTFTDDYVAQRKQSMGWVNGDVRNAQLLAKKEQCEHILLISKNNKTISDEMINRAVEQRAKALGLKMNEM